MTSLFISLGLFSEGISDIFFLCSSELLTEIFVEVKLNA